MNTFSDNDKDKTSTLVSWLGHVGYTAKAFVYGAIGVLALMQVMGWGGDVTGSRGAIMEFRDEPFGQTLMWAIAIGLLAYTLWRFSQGFLDVENKGKDGKALIQRAGLVISGGVYASLAISVISVLLGSGRSGASGQGGSQAEQRASEAMSYPGGEWALIAVGIGLFGAGLYQLYRAYAYEFNDHWIPTLSSEKVRMITRLSRFGITARSLVFLLMGGYIAWAGFSGDAEKSMGFGEALRSFSDDPWLLGVTAVGVLCYAIYTGANAMWRRIPAN